ASGANVRVSTGAARMLNNCDDEAPKATLSASPANVVGLRAGCAIVAVVVASTSAILESLSGFRYLVIHRFSMCRHTLLARHCCRDSIGHPLRQFACQVRMHGQAEDALRRAFRVREAARPQF